MSTSKQANNHSASKERLLLSMSLGSLASPLQEQLPQKQMPLKNNQKSEIRCIVAGCGLLITVASLVERELQDMQVSVAVAHGFHSCSFQALEHRFNSHGTWVQLLCSTWDLPSSGIELVSPALAGRFFTTEPPGRPL